MNDQEEYDNLITLKKEYKKKLKDIKQKISDHPITIKQSLEKGIKALNFLISDSDYYVTDDNHSWDGNSDEDHYYYTKNKNSFLTNYIENTIHGVGGFRPGAICTCEFYCINDFYFEITIDIHESQEYYEVSISITNKKLQINKKYYNIFEEDDYNYDAFVKEFKIDSVEFEMFKPFFKIDDGNAYEYVMC